MAIKQQFLIKIYKNVSAVETNERGPHLLRAAEGMILLHSLQTKMPTKHSYNTKRPVCRELIFAVVCPSFRMHNAGLSHCR